MLNDKQIKELVEKARKIADVIYEDTPHHETFIEDTLCGWEMELYNDKNTRKLFKNHTGDEIQYEYNENGDVILVIEGTDSVQEYEYDEHNRLKTLTCIVDGNKYITEYTFDEQGNTTSEIKSIMYKSNPSNIEVYFKTEYEYNENNKVKRIIITDLYADVNIYTYEYDDKNRVILERSDDGEFETVHRYDDNTNTETIVTYGRTKIINRYDDESRIIFCEEIDTSGYEDKIVYFQSYEYDSNGNLIHNHRMYKYNNEEIDVENTYNDNNNIISSKLYDPASGNILGYKKCIYNDGGKIIAEIYWENVLDVTIYEYNQDGNILYSVILHGIQL